MRILIVVHGLPPAALGGTEMYAWQQARALAAGGDDVVVFTREADPERPEYAVRDESRDGLRIRYVNRTFRDVTSFADSYRPVGVTARLEEFIDVARPDVAHIHHLTCLSTGIVAGLKRRGVPTVLTLHDYWMLCHRGQLLDLDLQRCADPHRCRRCLDEVAPANAVTRRAARALRATESHLPRRAADLLHGAASAAARMIPASAGDPHEDRWHHMMQALDQVDQIVSPSRYLAARYAAAGVSKPIDLLEYGTDLARFSRRHEPRGLPLRVGFLGSLMISKAPHLLLEARHRLPSNAVAAVVAGAFTAYHGDGAYSAVLTPLLAEAGVDQVGPLPPAQIPAFFSRLDVLAVPSIWEENSPLVIREAFAAGVPVVASRIGGIPETVTDEVNGLLFDPGSADDLARQLRRLVDDPDLLPKLRDGIPPLLSLAEATSRTRAIYARLIARAASDPHAAADAPAAVVLNYGTPDETLLSVRALLASRRPFSQVIVVDNAADEECRGALADVMPEITFISAGGNLGFSGGVNLGIRRALANGATHVLLVNSDVVLPARALDALLDAISAPGRGIAGPIVLSRSVPDRVASAGMRFSDRSGRMRHHASNVSIGEREFADWQPVAGVSGCAMLVKREVFDTVGLLPEEYFFSFEDLAFCLAARDRGFDVGVAGRARAYHQGSRSMGASPRRLYFAARNHLLVASARPGGWLTRTSRAAAITGYNVAHALTAAGAWVPARLDAVLRGVADHLRGRYGPDDRT